MGTTTPTPMPPGTNAVEWAKANGDAFAFKVQLDNRPIPEITTGIGYKYFGWPGGREAGQMGGVVLTEAHRFVNAHESVFVIQEHSGWMRPMYVAGWHAKDGYMILHPYSTHPEWMLGPKRCYLLKVQGRGGR